MAYEILVLDIDGTLTTSEKVISTETKAAIMDIQQRGHKVVLASGRPTPGIRPLANQLRLEDFGGYMLSYNGAKIINCKTNETMYQNTIPTHMISKIYDAALEFNVGLITYEENEILVATEIDEYIIKESKINGIGYRQVEHFVEYIDFDINKCLMTGDPTHLAQVETELKARFGDVLNIYRSEPFFLEIMPHHVDKAFSLGKLLDQLDLSREQMISCGDGFNDLTMIQYAGMGVAMANAQQVVKEAADYITLSNDDNGIVHVINEFML